MEATIGYYNILAQRAVSEEDAFVELYGHFFPRVYNFIYTQLKDAAEADDVTGIAFEKMYEHLREYSSEKAAFSTWLFRIASNAVRDHVRKRANRKETEWSDFFDPAAPEHETPESRILGEENDKELLKALSRLDEREQRIVSLKYWSDCSNKEIAEMMGISYSNVSTILTRALKRLKKFYMVKNDE